MIETNLETTSVLNYREQELLARKQNIADLQKSLLQEKIPTWLNEKISSFCERYGFDTDFIRYKILIDDIFAVNFIKDPIKQSFHQELAVRFMEKLPEVQNFKMLPSTGSNALYVIAGLIQTEEQKKQSSINVKSIDFAWSYVSEMTGEIINCYASHKYTHQGGGSQDNQFADLKRFMDEAAKHRGNNFFYAICDGQYYQMPYENKANKIAYLNGYHSGIRCCALTINEVAQHMKDYL